MKTEKHPDDLLPEEKVALAQGFFENRLVERGEKFPATRGDKARWFKPANSTDADAVKALTGEPDLLDKPIVDILKELPGMSVPELRGLRNAEMSGKTRKGLIAKIEDEIANRRDAPPTPPADDDDIMS